MTEHAAVIFVFFFLAEYASIVLICILISILYLGGYIVDFFSTMFFLEYIDFDDIVFDNGVNNESILSNPLIEGSFYGLVTGIKASVMIFIFI
jgi:NADH-ubiquinone oxidoreductase chain 1